MGSNSRHNHTLDIEILIRDNQEEFAMFNDNEKMIDNYFDQYEGKYINELEEFIGTNSTIEDMGYVFFKGLKALFEGTEFEMDNIAVSETPSRKYVVSDFLINGVLNDRCSKHDRKLSKFIDEKKNDVLKRYEEYRTIRESRRLAEIRKKKDRIAREKMLLMTKKKSGVGDEELFVDEEYSSAKNRERYSLDSYGLIKKQGINKLEVVLYILITIALSIGLFFVLKSSDILKNTEEVYIHLGKARYLLTQLKNGVLSPIYMKSWYDGYMMFMHSEPLTYYTLALMGYIFNSDMMLGYAATLSIIFAFTVSGFTFLGRVYDKAFIGFISGILWFTMPEISRHYIITGDIKVLVALAFLPFCFAYIAKYFQNRGRFMPLKIITSMWLIVLADLSIAIIVFIGFLTIFTIKVFYTKQDRKLIMTVGCVIMSVGLSAGWLYSAYRNGSIPEFYTNNNGYYIGATLFVILVGCIFFAYQQLRTYAIAAIIVGLLALYKLPVVVIIMYIAIIFIFLEWKKCDRKVILALLLIIGMSNVYRLQANVSTKDNSLYVENEKIKTAVEKAGVVTNDNLLYLDIDKEATYPGYYMVDKNKDIVFSNKSSMKYNVITDNIQMLKYAVYAKRFDYIFDRSLEMGCDTILFNLKGLIITQQDNEKLNISCKKFGYDLVAGSINEKYLIFHKDINRKMGNITKYQGIAIGKSSRNVSLIYPYFENGMSDSLDDYSVKRLSKYKKIYLSGFKYKKLKDAEKKVRTLAKKGIDIYVDMDGIPADPLTNRQKFLDVTAQTVSFKENFPEFTYKTRKIVPKKFYKEYSEWNTVYIENVDKVEGYCMAAGRTLPYAGTKMERVHFMGLNILYHVIEANDVSIQFIVDDFFNLEEGTSPVRRQKNLNIKYKYDRIEIDSRYGNMIAPISYQRVFRGNKKIRNVNNMLMVKKGKTVLTFDYKNFYIGVGISIFMIIFMILTFAVYKFRLKKRDQETVRE